jgi:uncharacterized OB-fold protein
MRTDDPVAFPFWEAARRGVLLVQRCTACGHHQFYPRPFCLVCDGDSLSWVECTGTGVVHSVTMVHVPVTPDLTPPYQVALVTLAEGPRLLTNIDGRPCRIGEPVRLVWRQRADAPPFPCFRAADSA